MHRSSFVKGMSPGLVCLFLLILQSPVFCQGIITTFAGTDWVFPGNGKPALNVPIGPIESVTIDRNGNLVLADPGSAVVLRLENSGTVTVLAGNGIQLYSGDGGPATSAALNSPFDAAYDANGNLYIADGLNNRVRKVTPGGTITTFAGTGQAGYSGDNGPAVNASLNEPYRIAVDSSGSVYVFDLNNSRIRRITSSGIISNFAGNGQAGFSGDNGAATQASLNDVSGMAFDSSGNLYISEFGNNRVRRIDTYGTITTIAGTGQAGYLGDNGPAARATLNSPGGVVVDKSNNIYISDTNNFVIRKINPQGVITTFAGNGIPGYAGDGGSATSAEFGTLLGLAMDPAGNLFIADRDNYRVRKITPGGIVSTVAGSGAYRAFPDGTRSSNAFLNWPFGVSADRQGNIYIADTFNNRIRLISSSGLVYTVAGNGAFEFSGDNGAGISAGLAGPESVTPDNAGNLYIADTDNNVIRKLAANGIITTIAGNVHQGYGGDNGPATQAVLNLPEQAVLDTAGNIYISDTGNNRIRKVTPDGRISTFAGNGQAGFSGDGGQAVAASLNQPTGLAFDAAGRLLVTDWGNSRVRAIDANGTISTLAGGGSQSQNTASPVPATQVALGAPSGLAADRAGNVYFSDSQTNRVLKVAAGMLTSIAGNGTAGFSGDGAPSSQASLNYPYGLALDSAGDLLIADVLNYRIRAVLAAPPLLQGSPSSLTFSAKSGGSRTDPQILTLTGSLSGLAYSLTASTTDGGGWLKADVVRGSLPATVQVLADPTGLQPGTYKGSLVASLLSGPQSQTIPVSLTVTSSDAPVLGIDSKTLTFSFVQGGAPSSQSLTVNNDGGGVLNFTANVSSASGGSWLTLSSASGQTTPVQPASLTLQADPGANPPGIYQSTLSVASTNGGTVNLPVTMTVSAANQKILLSQTGLKFTAVAQGGTPLPQTVSVLNGGQGALNWKIQASTLSGAAGWLTATPSPDQTSLTVSVNPVPAGSSSLAPGDYYGQIQVLSAGADNSPQLVSVILSVLPAANDPGPQLQTSGLIFAGTPGNSPGSQNIMIADLGAKSVNYSIARTTSEGQNWLLVAPASGTVVPNQPAQVIVQPDFSHLSAGTYHGRLTFSFDSGAVRAVDVLALVTSSGASSVTSSLGPLSLQPDTANCSNQPLQIQFQSLGPNFIALVGQPTTLQVQVTDCAGSPVQPATGIAATVTATFSNGDPVVSFTPGSKGVWTATWRPVNLSKNSAVITVTAFQIAGTNVQSQQVNLTGTLASSTTPTVPAAGVVHAASFAAGSVAPGTLISVFGTNLTDGTGGASGLPLPGDLNGTEVRIGSQSLPLLFASPDQINVQIPYDVQVDTQFQISVQRGAALSVPESLVVAPAQPGIFTVNQQGNGQGVIFKSDQVTLAEPGTPAAAGETIVIYCTGLGAVTPAVAAGTPAPSPPAPLSTTVNTPVVMIGGQPAQVMFSGLSPGFAGLYQINAVVPAGVTPSDAVPVTVSVAGQVSAPVTIAVR